MRMTPFSQISDLQANQRFLVEGFIPADSLVALVAETGIGKSSLVIDMALRLSTGTYGDQDDDCEFANSLWLGRQFKPCSVVYIDAEGRSAQHRIAVRKKELLGVEAELSVIDGDIDLLSPDCVKNLAAELKKIDDDRYIDLIIIDTLSQAMPGGDENGAKDMTAFIGVCRRLMRRFGCTVLVLHHPGHRRSGSRGHSSLPAAVDAEIIITKEPDGRRIAEVTKMREGVIGLKIPFRLTPFEVIVNDKPATGCRVELAEAMGTSSPRRPVPVGAYQKMLYSALERCAASSDGAVSLADLRQAAAAVEFAGVDGKHRSTRINDSLKGLRSGGVIGFDATTVWLCDAESSPCPTPPFHPPKGGMEWGGAVGGPRNTRNTPETVISG